MSKIDSSKEGQFRIKATVYVGLFIFAFGFSFAGAPFISMMCELFKAYIITILATFIITDVLIFTKTDIPKFFKTRKSLPKEYLSFSSIPFMLGALLLSLLTFQFTTNYEKGMNYVLGPIYVISPLIPMIGMCVCLYGFRKKLWIVIGLTCLLLQFFILGTIMRPHML